MLCFGRLLLSVEDEECLPACVCYEVCLWMWAGRVLGLQGCRSLDFWTVHLAAISLVEDEVHLRLHIYCGMIHLQSPSFPPNLHAHAHTYTQCLWVEEEGNLRSNGEEECFPQLTLVLWSSLSCLRLCGVSGGVESLQGKDRRVLILVNNLLSVGLSINSSWLCQGHIILSMGLLYHLGEEWNLLGCPFSY